MYMMSPFVSCLNVVCLPLSMLQLVAMHDTTGARRAADMDYSVMVSMPCHSQDCHRPRTVSGLYKHRLMAVMYSIAVRVYKLVCLALPAKLLSACLLDWRSEGRTYVEVVISSKRSMYVVQHMLLIRAVT